MRERGYMVGGFSARATISSAEYRTRIDPSRSYDFQILHEWVRSSVLPYRRQSCFCADGQRDVARADFLFALEPCAYCGVSLGFKVPIFREMDGSLKAHLSCVIERELERTGT